MVLPRIALPRLSFGLSLGILLAIAIALTLALTPTGAAADHGGPHPVVDGFVQDPVTGVVEEAYVIQGITYTQDQLTGDFAGLLYTAEDDNNFYFGFAQSVFVNDNTYFDGNKNDPNNPEIGWEDSIGRAHRIQDLLQSEHIEVQIFSTPDNTGVPVLDFFLDYASDDVNGQTVGNIDSLGPIGGDGLFITGTVADIPEWSSSLDWNINDATPTFSDNPNSSPRRILTNTYDPGTTADPNSPWIYETVYEWSVAKSAFPQANPTLEDISISILEVHNSPVKAGNPVPIPVINVKKESNPPSGSDVAGGQLITYTVTVENTGLVPITGMVITDVPDSNLTNIVPLDGGGFAGGTITWPSAGTFPTLAVGATLTVQFQANVISPTAVGTDIFNTGTISADQLPTPAQTNTTVHTVTGNPAYTIVKTVTDVAGDGTGLGSVDAAGEVITYSIVVTNTGNLNINGVVLTDALLEGAGGTLGAAVESGTADSILSVGETFTYTGTYTATQADIDNNGGGDGDIDNTASVVSTEITTPQTASEDVPIVQAPAYTIVKTVTDVAGDGTGLGSVDAAGEVITYSIVVTNTGNQSINGVVLTDALLEGAGGTLGAAVESGTADSILSVGETFTYTGTYTAAQADIDNNGGGDGDIDNTASVVSTEITTPQTASEDVPIVQAPAYNIVKTVTDVADDGTGLGSVDAAGEVITYSILVTNTGNQSINGVVLTDALLEGAGGTLGAAVESGTADSILSVGETFTYTGTYTATQADIDNNGGGDGDIDNTASVVSTEITTPQTSSEDVPIVQAPAYNIVKTVTDVAGDGTGLGSVNAAGEVITYSIVVTNAGNQSINGVVLTDALLQGAGGTLGAAVESGTADGIPSVGESFTYAGTYTVAQSDIDNNGGGDGDIDNTASVVSTEITTPQTASEDVPIVQAPAYNIVKTVTDVAGDGTGLGSVDAAGEVITYSIVVTNTGNQSINSVVLTDALLEGAGGTLGAAVESGTADGILSVGESFTYAGTYTATQADIDNNGGGDGDIDNTASVVSTEITTPQSASEDVPVVQNPDVQVAKSAAIAAVTSTISNVASVVTDEGPSDDNLLNPTESSVIVAHDITYTITVNNTGNVTLNNATVSDNVPAGTKFTSISSSQGTCDLQPDASGTVSCNLGTLNVVGGSATVTLVVQTTN